MYDTKKRITGAKYLHRIDTLKYSRNGTPYAFTGWLGRVDVDGKPRSIVRSSRKRGERLAYLECLVQVVEWLKEVYPLAAVNQKEAELLSAAPGGEARRSRKPRVKMNKTEKRWAVFMGDERLPEVYTSRYSAQWVADLLSDAPVASAPYTVRPVWISEAEDE